ncbi:hypothetical protein CIRMBP1241_00706 [Enterococcus cecorum]|nr:hypothetical protein CIRMBP1242_00548 [Enterococcus cecorum]CAI3304551.1 hypothetical protein CIRMBP1241_00706 [Enterococcus cecorum]
MSNNYHNERIDNCTFVKTALMVLVIVYHSILFWGANNWLASTEVVFNSPVLAETGKWLNSFHIYGFTLVSGYLFYFLKCQKTKYSNHTSFVLNKSKRLVVPFIFISIVWAAPIGFFANNYSINEIVKRYLLGINPNQLWFLLMLFWVFVLFWPLAGIVDKKPQLGILVSLIFWGIGILGGHIIQNYYGIWYGFQFFIYFCTGFYIRKYEKYLKAINGLIYVVIGILFYAIYRISGITGAVAIVCSLPIHLVEAVCSFEFLQWLATKVNWKENKVFMFLSKRSMPIYLFHQQVIYFIIIWLNGKVNPYVNAVVNFVVAMAVSVLISSILMRFKVTRFLIGEK